MIENQSFKKGMMNLPIFKKLAPLLAFFFIWQTVLSQDVIEFREATLVEGGYVISGSAFLELLDDGSLQVRLTQDYSTPRGPDVQLYLSNNPTQISGGLFVENLSDENAFSGAHSWNLGSDVGINDYNYIIFRCVAFGLHWAGGTFGGSNDGGGGNTGGGDDCMSSATATTDWVAEVTICPSDGNDDIIPLKNTLSVDAGSTYAYVITDSLNRILNVHLQNDFNFENSGDGQNRVYGISYSGMLDYNIGDDWMSITSSGCIEFSNPSTYLTVNKDGCSSLCESTAVATTNWVSNVDICPDDGEADVIELKNTKGIPAGNAYAYVITNFRGDIITVHYQDTYNFEGSGNGTNRVYGISYNGNLTYNEGDTWNTIRSDGCIEYSDENIFLTVTKAGDCIEMPECFETNVASTAWVTDFSICPDDGESDSIFLQNNLFIPGGDTYAFVLTDENQRIKKIILDDWYDFEGSGLGEERVYGVSYEGTLSYNAGDLLSTITADGCATISSQELFIKVTKDGCAAETGSISGRITNFRGQGVGNVMISLNTGATTMTNSDGDYTFSDLPLGQPYTLTPSRDDNHGNGLSAQDLVIMQRHILGLQVIENPFLFIAADANKDERVSALDVINFLNLIIGRTTTIPNNTSWRFVPSTKSFDNGEDPFDFIEKDAVQNLTGDVTDLNFTALKTGDVSGNAR